MKKVCKIENIIRKYRNHPDELILMIEKKKIGIKSNSKTKREEELMQCNLEILKKALRKINKLIFKETLSKAIPFIISLYFLLNEILYIENNINLVQQDIYLQNAISIVVILKIVIIFFVFPLFIIEKIINHFLRLDSEYFPIKLFYNLLYFLIFLIITIKIFELI